MWEASFKVNSGFYYEKGIRCFFFLEMKSVIQLFVEKLCQTKIFKADHFYMCSNMYSRDPNPNLHTTHPDRKLCLYHCIFPISLKCSGLLLLQVVFSQLLRIILETVIIPTITENTYLDIFGV